MLDHMLVKYRWPKPRHHPYEMLEHSDASDEHIFQHIMHSVQDETASEWEYSLYHEIEAIYG